MKSNRNLFIVGTDTDVGKTYVSSLLFKALKDKNYGYYKPIQSGCIEKDGSVIAPDPQFLCSFSSIPYDSTMCTYMLKPALSPHLASEIDKVEISLDTIEETFNKKLQNYASLIVEGAGGVFVPLIRDKFFIYDLIKQLDLPVILVGNTRVGAINHMMLAVKFLQSQNIEILGLVFNRYRDEFFEKDNIDIIANASKINNILIIEENQSDLDSAILENFLKGEMMYE